MMHMFKWLQQEPKHIETIYATVCIICKPFWKRLMWKGSVVLPTGLTAARVVPWNQKQRQKTSIQSLIENINVLQGAIQSHAHLKMKITIV